MTMTIDVKSSLGTWRMGRNFRVKALVLAVVIAVGLLAWMMPSGPSDAQNQSLPAQTPVISTAQNTSWLDPAVTPTVAALTTPAEQAATGEAITPEQTAPVDGLKISSQSWRRGGLGSKALITFTLRNANDYAVRDIEISCAFARRDGSHLTDRTRLIHDTVNMKSRKIFASMHVGFVNINASKAKCSLLAASHI
jgi:hypothetical protein